MVLCFILTTLLAPTVSALQTMLSACELELRSIGMQINVSKSVCLRFGKRYDYPCFSIVSSSGYNLQWAQHCKYLGVEFVSGRALRCSFDYVKKKIFRSFNAIFGKIGRIASEEVVKLKRNVYRYYCTAWRHVLYCLVTFTRWNL